MYDVFFVFLFEMVETRHEMGPKSTRKCLWLSSENCLKLVEIFILTIFAFEKVAEKFPEKSCI